MSAADGIDRLLDRQHLYTLARRVICPHCAQPGNCTDRWGQPTSFVHPSRMTAAGLDPTADPYPLTEIHTMSPTPAPAPTLVVETWTYIGIEFDESTGKTWHVHLDEDDKRRSFSDALVKHASPGMRYRMTIEHKPEGVVFVKRGGEHAPVFVDRVEASEELAKWVARDQGARRAKSVLTREKSVARQIDEDAIGDLTLRKARALLNSSTPAQRAATLGVILKALGV